MIPPLSRCDCGAQDRVGLPFSSHLSMLFIHSATCVCLPVHATDYYYLERDIFGTVAQNKSMFFAISSITNIVLTLQSIEP